MNFNKKFFILITLSLSVSILTLTTDPLFDMNTLSWKMLGLVFIMALFWISEIIPLGVTAIIPIVYAPLAGLDTLKNVTMSFGNPIIFLFLGGFVLGIAMEKWGLHQRISLFILSKIGTNPKKQLIGFMGVSAVFSMWISNTAAAVMLLPVALSIINNEADTDEQNQGFGKALLIGIAYSASVGGMGTLIGTPPNTLLRGFLESSFDIKISFLDWMLFAMPVVISLLIIIYFLLVKIFKLNELPASKSSYHIEQQFNKLGKMNIGEKIVIWVFIFTSLSWVCKDLINKLFQLNLSDEIIAMIALLALFLAPVNLRNKEFAMDIDHLKKVPWDILLLFGGGLALSNLFIKTGFSHWVTSNLAFLGGFSTLLIVFAVVMLIISATEFTSNTAITATFLPLIGALSMDFNINPLILAIPLTLAASCAFMMPVGTPPNAIIFGSGKLVIIDMFKPGVFLYATAIILISLYSYFIVPQIFIN